MATAKKPTVSTQPVYAIEGSELVIRFPLRETPPRSKVRTSASGKDSGGQNLIAASSGGFTLTGLQWLDRPLRVNLTAIIPAEDAE